MDFGALPPEINSARMYAGPGPGTLLAASAGWESLAAELSAAADGYQSVIATLTDESWLGVTSMTMAAAVTPYTSWMRLTAAQCEQAASQATAAAAAYETAFAMTVPPALVLANRARLLALIATNLFGQNTPAIMATEAEYGEMWAQDATAMYNYAAGSAQASSFSAFTSPPRTTNPGGIGQSVAVTQAAATQAGGNADTASAQLISSVPQALQGLSTPGASLGSSGASAPMGALSTLSSTSGKSVTKTAGAGTSAVNGLAATAAPALSANTGDMGLEALGLSSDVAGFGADGAGLGADGGGIGIDLQGLQMDYQGLQLDYEGAGSILGAEGVPGFQAPAAAAGGLGGMAPAIGQGAGASASVGQAASLGTLSVPPSWADTVSSVTPLPASMPTETAPGAWGAVPSAQSGVSKLPLGGMVGRESEGAVQRIGFRPTMFPRSPAAG
ncbi:PPE family protein [Mycobacterium palustre]|uniref:PPE family protein n=1 Tax=Mycobacterium palustre TaxID=153971 RepID=A0A1X1Z520_9MYCO|nr:PPE family protein [Mycobacterium palustre]MCV7103296.1 PPE family protein [Mycobacterium palustre]ORW18340.1 hypothetical protein AWC19_19730 [Mycobacterium palustre]